MDRRNMMVGEEKEFKTYQGFLIGILALSVICLFFVGFITLKFIFQFRTRKIVFGLFLLTLNIALISRITYISRMLYKNRAFHCFKHVSGWGTMIAYTHILFLGVGGIINIYNWLVFISNIRGYERSTQIVRRKRDKLLRIIFPMIISFVFLWYGAGFAVRGGTDEAEDIEIIRNFIEWFGIVMTACLGVGYIVVGYILRRKIRNWNEDFEAKIRKRINFSVYLLSIPFFVRAIFGIGRRLTNLDQKMTDSIRDDTLFAPIVHFSFILIADLLPITSQLATMLVALDKSDTGRYETEYNGDTGYENSYYNNVAAAVGSHTSSLLSENDEFKKQFIQNGSRDYSGGIKFNIKPDAVEDSRINASDDSDD